MPLPVPVETTLVALREVVRALATPLHVLAFLPRRRAHVERSRRALEASMAAVEAQDEGLRGFLEACLPADGGAGRVFLSCGEASGEAHALHLLDAVEERCAEEGRAPPRWLAFGGARLRERGVEVRFPLAEHAVMGLAGVLASIPLILRAFAAFLRLLRDDSPDLIVLIDYPGLHLVMAETARRRGVPVLHYVAPQYWAWGPWRMKRYRRAVDATLTILPFEPAFFAGHELASVYVGHPLLDQVARQRVPVDDDGRPVLVLMPGSRKKEIALHLAPMVGVAERLRRQRPDLRVVIPHRDADRAERIVEVVEELGASAWVEVHAVEPSAWLQVARATLAKSGTGSLESCLHGVPTCIVYVVQGVVARWILHNMLTVPFFGGANLCMARSIVPELAIERQGQWDDVQAHAGRLLDDGPERSRCLQDLAALRERLGEPGASARAARWIVPFCPTSDTDT